MRVSVVHRAVPVPMNVYCVTMDAGYAFRKAGSFASFFSRMFIVVMAWSLYLQRSFMDYFMGCIVSVSRRIAQ
jgi:hypothetical protein